MSVLSPHVYSPSHRPTEPPTAERKELRLGFMKSVVVTWTEGENVMSMTPVFSPGCDVNDPTFTAARKHVK